MVSLYNFMFITGELLIDFTGVNKGQQPSYVFEKTKQKLLSLLLLLLF